MKPEPRDLKRINVYIKRADGTHLGEDDMRKCNPWFLCYPAADYDAGHIGFRWDEDLHGMCPGRYIAEIRDGCTPCARFELVVPECEHQVGGTFKNLTREDISA
jgi:hypothetical protein